MSGAPGSGKSTMAALLGQRLRLPVINKDRLRQATLWGLGVDDINQAPWGPGLWYPVMESLLGAQISVIGDMTLFPGICESDIAERLAPLAQLVQVFCRCEAPIERFVARSQADPLHRRDTQALLPQVTELAAGLQEPLALGCPTFVVDTTDGYHPSIDDLVERLITGFAPHLRVLLEPPDLPGREP
jgi:predicted kinase